jgi:hypothetical protein
LIHKTRGIITSEKYIALREDTYNAVMDLQASLQEAYGNNVTLSDTIDFLGHQFFVHQRLLDVASFQLEKMANEKTEPTMIDKILNLAGMSMPKDATCFIKADIAVPIHWISTRWLIDIEGRNVLKCVTEPEKQAKKDIYKIDVS